MLDKANLEVAAKVDFFIRDPSHHDINKVCAGFIVTGPSGVSGFNFFARLLASLAAERDRVMISLEASDCPNLKSCLKALIRKGVGGQNVRDDEDDSAVSAQDRSRLLNFDLQLLQQYCTQQEVSKVIVAFPDSEAYAASLLSDIITLLQYGGNSVSILQPSADTL